MKLFSTILATFLALGASAATPEQTFHNYTAQTPKFARYQKKLAALDTAAAKATREALGQLILVAQDAAKATPKVNVAQREAFLTEAVEAWAMKIYVPAQVGGADGDRAIARLEACLKSGRDADLFALMMVVALDAPNMAGDMRDYFSGKATARLIPPAKR